MLCVRVAAQTKRQHWREYLLPGRDALETSALRRSCGGYLLESVNQIIQLIVASFTLYMFSFGLIDLDKSHTCPCLPLWILWITSSYKENVENQLVDSLQLGEYQYTPWAGMSESGPKVSQICRKWDKSGTFRDKIWVYFGSASPRLVLFDANVTYFGP